MFALLLQRETKISDKIKSGILHVELSGDVLDFRVNEIIPVIVRDNDTDFKVGESKVVRHNVLSVTIEVHIDKDKNFIPIFEFGYTDIDHYREADIFDLRYLINTKGYESIRCLTRGKYKR